MDSQWEQNGSGVVLRPMTFSRFRAVRRLLGTTLLLVGLSFAMSPELLAEDPSEEESQGSEEPTADPPEDVPNEPRPASDEEESPFVEAERKAAARVAVDTRRLKSRRKRSGFRAGACLGLDTTCTLMGIKAGYAGRLWGLEVSTSGISMSAEANLYPQALVSGKWGSGRFFVGVEYGFSLLVESPVYGLSFGMDTQLGPESIFLLQPKCSLWTMANGCSFESICNTEEVGLLVGFSLSLMLAP